MIKILYNGKYLTQDEWKKVKKRLKGILDEAQRVKNLVEDIESGEVGQ